MKKLFTKSLSTIMCAMILFTAAAAQAGPGGDKVSGTGNTMAVAEGIFQGTADVRINNQNRTAAVTTYLLSAPTASEDGTLKAITSHTFTFSDGSSFTTLDRAVLSPTAAPGVYNLNTKATISDGAGDFTDVLGSLKIHGTLDFNTGQATWKFNGRICDYR